VAHGGLEDGVVGELLHAGGEGGDVADGDDEAFDAVGEEVFAAGVGGAEDGAATGQSLTLHESEAFFNAGQDHEMAGGHQLGEFGLGDGAEELNVVLR